jgi:hypothetical protein
MIAIRRGYVFLSCAIALQASTWAAIYLLRNLLTPGQIAPPTSIAFQIAVIVITLPIYLAHWVWAERLAARDPEERASLLRRLYLYGMLALFTAPLATNVFGVVRATFDLALGVPAGSGSFGAPEGVGAFIHPSIAILILAVLWAYHWRVIAADSAVVPATASAATVHRLYVLGFSAAGLIAMTSGAVTLIRRMLAPIGSFGPPIASIDSGLPNALAQALVGAGMWLIFWTWAGRLFDGPSEAERRSALRKLYLYTVVFVAALMVVTSAAMILAGMLRVLLGLEPSGDIREPLSLIAGLGVVWAYHARVLRHDAAAATEAPRAAAIRRLYDYLVAAIGLAAFLIGLGGVASVLIRALSVPAISDDLKNMLALSTAAVIVGLPVWALPWRRVQAIARGEGDGAADERRSFVRKLYLYIVLLATGVTVLTSAVYIVYRAVSWILGAEVSVGELGTDLAQAISYALIAGAAWVAHGLVLRGDGSQSEAVQAARLSSRQALILDRGEASFGPALAAALAQELPGLGVERFSLITADGPAASIEPALLDRIATADVVIGPWDIAVPAGEVGAAFGVSPGVAAALSASPATKLILPTRGAGWDWAGVDRWDDDAMVEQTVHALKQWAAGEEIRPERPLGVGVVIGIAVGVLILLSLLGIPVLIFLSNMG